MNIAIVSAKNPRRMEGDDISITLDVLFSHLSERVPFTAKADDSEIHGRELYVRAMRGEYGEIEVVAPSKPTNGEQQSRLDSKMKQAAAAMAPLEDAEKLGIITPAETDQLTALRTYRVALYRLPQSEGWPTDVEWPTLPAAAA